MNRILLGDALEQLRTLADNSVHCCVTSPPYFRLRDYQITGQIGIEETPKEYIARLVAVFGELKRVLRKDGTLWVNIGDSYAAAGNGGGGSFMRERRAHSWEAQSKARGWRKQPEGLKQKDLIGIPEMLAFAVRDELGYYWRSKIIWAKPNSMPGSQDDRPTSSYEVVHLFSQQDRYWSDFDAIKTPPREASLIRTLQDVQAQAGSHRANGGAKTNGSMKAVGVHALKELPEGQANIRKARDKQRGHSRRHAGFNDRWDAMDKAEQQAQPAMMRDVWVIPPATFKGAHFAVMPEELARRCILAGCPEGGTVLDPFCGAGTTGAVAKRLGRDFIGIELNPSYIQIAEKRLAAVNPLFDVEAIQ